MNPINPSEHIRLQAITHTHTHIHTHTDTDTVCPSIPPSSHPHFARSAIPRSTVEAPMPLQTSTPRVLISKNHHIPSHHPFFFFSCSGRIHVYSYADSAGALARFDLTVKWLGAACLRQRIPPRTPQHAHPLPFLRSSKLVARHWTHFLFASFFILPILFQCLGRCRGLGVGQRPDRRFPDALRTPMVDIPVPLLLKMLEYYNNIIMKERNITLD